MTFVSPRCRSTVVAVAFSAAGLLLSAGCQSGQDKAGTSMQSNIGTVETAPVETDLELRYVVGPNAARHIGYQIDWQYPSFTNHQITRLEVQHDSVFALDSRNTLLRLDRDSGRRIWEIPVADPTDEILSIDFVPATGRIYLLTIGEIFSLDAATGAIEDRRRLKRLAATEPILHGQFMIYGSRDGKLSWFSYLLGAGGQAYQIADTIRIPPVYSDGYVVAIGSRGTVMSLFAGNASQVWSRNALDEIVASPAIGDGVVYVASLDQHLRAYELGRPRSPLWDYLTESPLTDSPVLVDDRIYQQVAAEGLLCFQAQPLDSPGGVVVWQCDGVTGSVLTRNGNDVLVWDDLDRSLAIIDDRVGALVETWTLPALKHLIADDLTDGALFGTGRDGRVIKLRPRS